VNYLNYRQQHHPLFKKKIEKLENSQIHSNEKCCPQVKLKQKQTNDALFKIKINTNRTKLKISLKSKSPLKQQHWTIQCSKSTLFENKTTKIFFRILKEKQQQLLKQKQKIQLSRGLFR